MRKKGPSFLPLARASHSLTSAHKIDEVKRKALLAVYGVCRATCMTREEEKKRTNYNLNFQCDISEHY